VGVTAGASAPEVLVQAVIDRLKELGVRSVRPLEGVEENVTFPLPKGWTVSPKLHQWRAASNYCLAARNIIQRR
jgi:4-hydroxy-3-methylbut-2-enyl diphosphate reductase